MKLFSMHRALLCSVVCALFSISSSYSQCPGNLVPQTIIYDTTVTGGGNDYYEFTFPQLDPSVGTQHSVSFETIITLKYSFELENLSSSSSVHKVLITRADEITYPNGGSIDMQIKPTVLGSYPLRFTDNVSGSGLDYIAKGPFVPLEDYSSKSQLTENLATFLGNGSVAVNYKANSLASVSNINSSLSGSAEDTILFRITYNYCIASTLPADMNSFKVIKLTSGQVELSWFTPDELAGSKYELQKSTDGRAFTTFNSITATENKGTNYQVNYSPTASDKNKLYFRIKEFEANGQPKYSPIKSVMLDTDMSEQVKIFPTLAQNSIRINFPVADKDDWQVNIISLSGQTVQQLSVKNTPFVKMELNSNITPGLYIVETKNKRTLQSQRAKIIVQ